jgi:type IV pilus biogenesis protein PilP
MRNDYPTRAAILGALFAASLTAIAAEPANEAAGARSTADSLARIENETLLLKAEERQMAVRLQLAAQRNDLAQRHLQTRQLERPARAGDPTVVAVEGIGHRMHATLMMENGSQMDAAIGEVLPNGMTVLSVRAGEVVVGRGRKERIRLAHAPAASGAGPAAAGVTAPARLPWTLSALPPPVAVANVPGGQP